MPDDRANTTHEVERVDISMLSETQRDMLWMRLRGHKVAYVFDGHEVTVSALRADQLAEAVTWVMMEVRSPPRGYYAQPHPFQRATGRGDVIAPRWRRIVAAFIDSVVLGLLSAIALRLGFPSWFVLPMSALCVVGMTKRWGRTIGKFLAEIRVVDATRRTGVTWWQSTVRWAAVGWVAIAGGWIGGSADRFLVLSQVAICAPALWDSQGRGLHDRLAGTVVLTG
ncbi:MAG: RDD family protein [Ilumatobacteraceae bacterium]